MIYVTAGAEGRSVHNDALQKKQKVSKQMKAIKNFFYGMMFIMGMIFVTIVLEIGMRSEDRRVEISNFQYDITQEYNKYSTRCEGLGDKALDFNREWFDTMSKTKVPEALAHCKWEIDNEGNIVSYGDTGWDRGVLRDMGKLMKRSYKKFLEMLTEHKRG